MAFCHIFSNFGVLLGKFEHFQKLSFFLEIVPPDTSFAGLLSPKPGNVPPLGYPPSTPQFFGMIYQGRQTA